MGALKPTSSKDDYYQGQITTVPDFENKGQLFKEGDRMLVCYEPAPEVLPSVERGVGVKAPKDTAPGFRAVIFSEEYLMANADLAVLIERPNSRAHPFFYRQMRAATSVDERLPLQQVYLKPSLSASTIKGRLSALEKQFRHRLGPEFQNKRRILVGQDQSITSG